jgi:hypothetical protein
MISRIFAWLKQAFSTRQMTALERFVASKNPQSPQEIEFWISEYDNEERLRSRMIALR